MATLTSYMLKIVNYLKGFIKISKVILQDRRGALGIVILALFIFIALAPSLLTHYDPLSTVQKIATTQALPTWYRYLPGHANLSENLSPIEDSSFSTSASMQQWKFTTNSSIQYVSLNYSVDEGSPKSGPGCLAIYLQRDENEQKVETLLSKDFLYPYSDPPKRWFGEIYAKVKGPQNIPAWSVEITFFIERAEDERQNLWSAKQGGTYGSGSWIKPSITGPKQYPPLIDSGILDPDGKIFSIPTNYTLGIEVVFNEKVSNATVYIDDLNLQLYGEAFGLLGTDNLGRDIFTQLLYGTRISLFVGLLGAAASTLIGLIVGLVSGYFGHFVDEALMRVTDVFLVIPELPLLLVLVAVLGSSLWIIIALIALLGWMGFARIVRSRVLTLKESSFVEASRVLGGSEAHIISKILIPNVMNFVYVTLAMSAPAAIYSEAYLSFLGLGDPTIMTWGKMLHDALLLPGGVQKWWWVVPPGLCIAAISIAFILIGHALDEVFNPKIRERF